MNKDFKSDPIIHKISFDENELKSILLYYVQNVLCKEIPNGEVNCFIYGGNPYITNSRFVSLQIKEEI